LCVPKIIDNKSLFVEVILKYSMTGPVFEPV